MAVKGRREPPPGTRLPGPGGCRRRCGRERERELERDQQCGRGALPALGCAQVAGGGRGARAGAEFFRSKPFPEHPWLPWCNRTDAGRGRGWNLCQLGVLVFVPERRCRWNHGTWCVLMQQGGQFALPGVNPRLPARSPHKIIARRNGTAKDERAATKAVLTKRLRNQGAAP